MEVVLQLTQDELYAWRNHPLTRKVFRFLEDIRQAEINRFADIPVQSLSAEKIALEAARLQGRISMVNEILALKEGQDEEN